MDEEMRGRAALVTGATRGIGFAIARSLVDCGANVSITARKPDELDAARTELDPRGEERCLAIRGSADDEQHQEEAVQATLQHFGRLDHLVLNAAISPQYGPLMDADLDAVRKTLEVNVTSVLAWIRQGWLQAMKAHGGSIVVVASVGGIVAGSPIGSYNVSKAAVIHLVRQLAVELGPTVRVNAVAPAVVKTDFARALYEGREEEVTAEYPLKRLGTPKDVSEAVQFLLSDRSDWITGECLVIDGGRTLKR